MDLEIPRERKILLSIDQSEYSWRAAEYVGNLIHGLSFFKITVLSVVEEPWTDIFASLEARDHYLLEKQKPVERLLSRVKQHLLDLAGENIVVEVKIRQQRSELIAQCILDEQLELGYGTIVIGRRGLSKSEEFLFGSVSSQVVRNARNCTVCVVA